MSTNEQIDGRAEHIATEKSGGVGFDAPSALGAFTTSGPTSVSPTMSSMPTSADAAAILTDVEREFENIQEVSQESQPAWACRDDEEPTSIDVKAPSPPPYRAWSHGLLRSSNGS